MISLGMFCLMGCQLIVLSAGPVVTAMGVMRHRCAWVLTCRPQVEDWVKSWTTCKIGKWVGCDYVGISVLLKWRHRILIWSYVSLGVCDVQKMMVWNGVELDLSGDQDCKIRFVNEVWSNTRVLPWALCKNTWLTFIIFNLISVLITFFFRVRYFIHWKTNSN